MENKKIMERIKISTVSTTRSIESEIFQTQQNYDKDEQ